MVQYMTTRLDTSFAALSDVTRRGVLEQLGRADASITDLADQFHMTLTGMKKHVGVLEKLARADASITDLAQHFDMTLTGMKKHVGVLEQAGLVITEKVGRVRTCRLGLCRLEEETAWLERYRQLWASRFLALDLVIEDLKRKEKVNGRKKRK